MTTDDPTSTNGHSPRDQADAALIAALVTGATYAQAGRSAGVSKETVYRRMKDGDFAARLHAAQMEIIDSATRKLTSLCEDAVDTLGKLLDDESGAVRLGASKAILERQQSLELERRLAMLEAEVRARGLRIAG